MTLITSWIGVDDKKEGKSIASIYIASDSRYTWGNAEKYDYGIKVFGSTRYPEIFGFCGDVLFPSIVFGQMIPQIDSGLILNDTDSGEIKNRKVFDFINSSLESYPKGYLSGTFTLLHATRINKEFKCYKTSYNSNKKLINKEIILPRFSTKIFSGGSGKDEFDANLLIWESQRHNDHRTSRGVYHCLVKTLKEIKDPNTGGLPQIVGLYRNKNSRLFGIIEDEKKYIYGKVSSEDINSTRVEWRNENFERMNPETLKIIEGAQRQPF